MNTVANLKNVLRMKRENDAWVSNLHNTHCGCFSLSYIRQSLSNQLIQLFSFKFVLIVHICPAFNGNVNKNASESLQTSYDHYKCLTYKKNDLQLVTNMLRMVTHLLRQFAKMI